MTEGVIHVVSTHPALSGIHEVVGIGQQKIEELTLGQSTIVKRARGAAILMIAVVSFILNVDTAVASSIGRILGDHLEGFLRFQCLDEGDGVFQCCLVVFLL